MLTSRRSLPPRCGRSTSGQRGAQNNEATIKTTAEHFNVNADAVIGLARPFPATVKVGRESLDLAALPIAGAPLVRKAWHQVFRDSCARPSMRLAISTEPEKGQANVALDALDGSWNGRPFTVTSPSPIQYADERLTVEKLEVVGQRRIADLDWQPAADRRGRGRRDRREPARQPRDGCAYLPPETNIAADGAIELTGSLRGTLKRIDPD